MDVSSDSEPGDSSHAEGRLFQLLTPSVLATALVLVLVVALGVAHEISEGGWLSAGALGLLGLGALCFLAREEGDFDDAWRARLWKVAVSLLVGAGALFALAFVL